ncbi:SCP-like protein, partial [Teladorsagia circumcincta]
MDEHVTMCSDSRMTDDLRQAFLDRHNMYRSRIAKGQAVNGIGGYAPKAKRMLKMIYDCDVEANTMGYIEKCVYGHNSYKDRNFWGQSIWALPSYQYNKTAAALWAVDSWFAELKAHGVPDNLKFDMTVFDRGIGHWTQLAWQWSYKIG